MKPNTLSGQASQILTANRLAQMKARPTVISAMTGISIRNAIQLYSEYHRERPKRGMLPHDSQWIIRSSSNCAHASIFCSALLDIKGALPDTDNSKAFIAAYEIYLGCTQKPEALGINRAWYLSRQVKSGEIGIKNCTECASRHLVITAFPPLFQQCPICGVWSDKTGRSRWKSIKICGYQ